jgi:hypothetical protein
VRRRSLHLLDAATRDAQLPLPRLPTVQRRRVRRGFIVRKSAMNVLGEVRTHETAGEVGRVARRAFCPKCGSPLFAQGSASEEFVSVRAATLEDLSWFRPTMDCFVNRWTAIARKAWRAYTTL